VQFTRSVDAEHDECEQRAQQAQAGEDVEDGIGRGAGADPDSVVDVRAVFQQGHRELAVDKMPPVLLPRKGRLGLIDYEKMFCPDPKAGDIFEMRGLNRETGCIVVVRPDQYVSHVLPLHGHEALADFFAGILVDAG
jgi:phenol 2-monooxygenase (NADPH)